MTVRTDPEADEYEEEADDDLRLLGILHCGSLEIIINQKLNFTISQILRQCFVDSILAVMCCEM